ncbi:MAG: methionine synthase, partial [Planctomycetota bacterium]
ELDNGVIDSFPELSFGIHLCRGNQGSRWLVSGSYEAIAEELFGSVHAARLLLEYDDERSGGFAPLRFVPADKTVVLGLVTTKSPRLESVASLIGRIEEAAAYIDLDRLALSPQCGFSTSIVGNAISEECELAKLRVIAETAREVWC